jgi:translation initiation factor IF-2
MKVLNLVLKADVAGSLEAIEEILKSLPQEKVILRILRSDVGEINENDVQLAKSSKGLVLGFRVKANVLAKNLAQKDKIRMLSFEIIYDLVEGVRKVMEKILEPETVRTDVGKLKVWFISGPKKTARLSVVGFWKAK